jgi:haloalkane dehalogenase
VDVTAASAQGRRGVTTIGEVDVLGTTMRYVEAGRGAPVVFLHGNPTSSYLWRHVLPRLTGTDRRLIALDLIGMGGSGKPDIGYHLGDHARYLTAALDRLDLDDIAFVAHDWGAALALEHLRRRPDRVRSVCVMECHVRPLAGWHEFDAGGRDLFHRFRTPGTGERLVLEENFLIETLLPAAVRRPLTPAEHNVYRRPYLDPAARRPLLQWTREIPIDGEPAGATDLLHAAWQHLSTAGRPTLLVRARPGAVVDDAAVAWCRRTVPGLEVAEIADAGHFVPEDQPERLAAILADWLAGPA